MDKAQVDAILELAVQNRDARLGDHRQQALLRNEASKRLDALRTANAERIKELTAKKED